MLRERDYVFELWAPSESPWSVWAKPVLFARVVPQDKRPDLFAPPQVSAAPAWAPHADGSTVIVADLPGVLSVHLAESLVRSGFRPVPLFNALPGPDSDDVALSSSVVDVQAIAVALEEVTPRLGGLLRHLPPEAPPVFLLDSRRKPGRIPQPGDFDNRSVSLPTDFPSAGFLQARGVSRAILLTDGPLQPAADLAHTLLRWQTAGIEILACAIDSQLGASEPRLIRVARPKWFRAIWHNALSLLGLRRSPLGGFGGTLPYPSSG